MPRTMQAHAVLCVAAHTPDLHTARMPQTTTTTTTAATAAAARRKHARPCVCARVRARVRLIWARGRRCGALGICLVADSWWAGGAEV